MLTDCMIVNVAFYNRKTADLGLKLLCIRECFVVVLTRTIQTCGNMVIRCSFSAR